MIQKYDKKKRGPMHLVYVTIDITNAKQPCYKTSHQSLLSHLKACFMVDAATIHSTLIWEVNIWIS